MCAHASVCVCGGMWHEKEDAPMESKASMDICFPLHARMISKFVLLPMHTIFFTNAYL